MMLRKYTLTGLLALSIAAAPVAAPSAMAKDNLDKFLIGLAAIGIVGAIAHESNKDKRQHVTYQKPVHKTHNTRHRHGNVIHSHPHRQGYHGHNVRKHTPKHVRTKPRSCLRQRWTNRGWVQYYSNACLKKHRY